MPSQFDEQFAGDAVTQLMEVHGETVIRWPEGNELAPENVTAIVDLSHQQNSPTRNLRGEDVPHEGRLVVAESQPTLEGDVWIIPRISLAPVWNFGREIDGGFGGLKEITIKRVVEVTEERGIRTNQM